MRTLRVGQSIMPYSSKAAGSHGRFGHSIERPVDCFLNHADSRVPHRTNTCGCKSAGGTIEVAKRVEAYLNKTIRVPAVYLNSAEAAILAILSICRINNLRTSGAMKGSSPARLTNDSFHEILESSLRAACRGELRVCAHGREAKLAVSLHRANERNRMGAQFRTAQWRSQLIVIRSGQKQSTRETLSH